MYSQGQEESIILQHVAEHGTFLDIGAYDGRTFSNTLKLAEMGWRGACVEASPSAFCRLAKEHASRPQIRLVQAAISLDTDGLRPFSWTEDAVSTIDNKHRARWAAVANYRDIVVAAVTPAELARGVGVTFDFINVDVEGFSVALAAKMLRAGFEATLWCIEADAELQGFGVWGLDLVARTRENVFLKKR